MKKTGLILFILVIGYMHILIAQPKQSTPGNILSASDIHFDPFFDPSLMPALIKADYKQWPAIFNSSATKQPNTYNSDSNFPLFVSAIAAMKQQNPSPAFIVITGDFLCHSFQSNYAKYARQYPDSVQSFTTKTIKCMALMFDQYFPKSI